MSHIDIHIPGQDKNDRGGDKFLDYVREFVVDSFDGRVRPENVCIYLNRFDRVQVYTSADIGRDEVVDVVNDAYALFDDG